MSDSSGGGCTRCCCSFIITSGLTALFMWLSLRTSYPKCLIQDFYVPALNTTDNSIANRNNHTIFLHLRLENVMKDKGVYYDNLNVNITIYNEANNTSLLIANDTVPGFRQGHHKKANKKKLFETRGVVVWDDAYKAALGNKSVFRVDFATRVRFKILFWKTKRHRLVVGANVTVDYSGGKIGKKKKGIKMKSGVADQHQHRCFHPLVMGLLILLHFLILL